MSKFDYIDQERITQDKTAEWVCSRIYGGEVPVLTVRPVSQTLNPGYTNAFVRRSGGAKQLAATQQRQLAARDFSRVGSTTRAIDRELYPEHVIVGWTGVVDRHGQPVEFSRDECRQWLEHIDVHVFDELRQFCLTLDNFAGAGVVSDSEVEEQGNGLPPGSSGN